jgi:hypothetical protein
LRSFHHDFDYPKGLEEWQLFQPVPPDSLDAGTQGKFL